MPRVFKAASILFLSFVCVECHSQPVFFQEDFESYQAGGASPPGGGWIGGGACQQPDNCPVGNFMPEVHSGLNSQGIWGGPSMMEVGFYSHAVAFPSVFTLDYWTMATGGDDMHCSPTIGRSGVIFASDVPDVGYTEDVACAGECFDGVRLTCDGFVKAGTTTISPCSYGEWLHVQIAVDVPKKKKRISVNDSPPVEIADESIVSVTYFTLFARTDETVVDDIKAFGGDIWAEQPQFHSADCNQDGTIDNFELLRTIEIWACPKGYKPALTGNCLFVPDCD